MGNKDIQILRDLAKKVAEAAALPKQEETRNLWRGVNSLNTSRPAVMIDQVPWNELPFELECQDAELRKWEEQLKRSLYYHENLPCDYVVDNFIGIAPEITGMLDAFYFDLGVYTQEHTTAIDSTSAVVSHSYVNQFETFDGIEKIKLPVLSLNKEETNRRMQLAQEIFGGIIDVRLNDVNPYISVWDHLALWMGVENIMFALADEPEFMLALANRMVECYVSGIKQLKELGVFSTSLSWIHCTGAWTSEANKSWVFGLAQPLGSVSPAMYEEFEIEPSLPIFEEFDLVYYGCCDSLDKKMDAVKRIPNLRKVSVSPWADRRKMAAQLGKDYVFSWKPNPAYLAMENFDEDLIRNDINETIEICKEFGCTLEIILKDVSTIKYQPERLHRWAEIAKECVLSK